MALPNIPWPEYLEQINGLTESAGYAKILATAACVYVAYRVVYALFLSPFRNFPGPLLARFTSKRAEFYALKGAQASQALKDYETYGDVYLFKPNAVSISNPRDARITFGSHAFRKPEMYKAHRVLGIENTLSARDPQLASMRRRQIGPYLSNSYLAKMEKAILTHGILAIKEKWDSLIEASKDGQVETNYHKTFLFATYDTIGSLAFGREFGALKNDDSTVVKWLDATLAYVGAQAMIPLFKWFPFSLLLSKMKRLSDDFIDHGAQCIATRRGLLAELEAKGEVDKKPTDLLQGLIEAEDSESKNKLSPIEVHAETVLFLGAGSETSSNTLLWTTHLLMLYPDCYKRAVEEVRSAFDREHVITFNEARASLPYLEACIYESMRRVPVAGAQLPRVAPREGVRLGSGHFIPGGTTIHVNINGVNHNKNYWQDPYRYDPTRFLNNDEAKKSIFTFATGVRICPGKQLAWIEIFTILANLLKDYDLRLPDDYTLRGPNVLDENGYPKLMDGKFFITRTPVDVERDCRIAIAKRQ